MTRFIFVFTKRWACRTNLWVLDAVVHACTSSSEYMQMLVHTRLVNLTSLPCTIVHFQSILTTSHKWAPFCDNIPQTQLVSNDCGPLYPHDPMKTILKTYCTISVFIPTHLYAVGITSSIQKQ